MSNIIVVVAEARSGKIKKPVHEAIGAARDLAQKCGGEVQVLVVGAGLDAAKKELAASGVTKVVAVESPALENYSGDGYAKALLAPLQATSAAGIVMANTSLGRDLLPRLSALLGTGLVSDAIALHFEDGKFGATKPVYAGKAYLKSMFEKKPFMATLRTNTFEVKPGSGTAAVTTAAASVDAASLLSVVKEIVAQAGGKVPLTEARVIVAGGRGLKAPENFKLVEDLAAAFGPGVAAVGASRAIVDAGWRPHSEQVGQTGKTVAPPLYFAIGISGAIQHIAGMRTARCIVAINKDPEAPIFKVADYGIVGDALEVLPVLTEAIKKAVAS